jgi:hypothetical protein
MKFTPKVNLVPIACGILTIAAVGWNEPVSRAGPAPARIVATQNTAQESFQTNGGVAITYAVDRIPLTNAEGATGGNVLPVHWYNSKHWWKRNAPIVGGAAGGALIGGVAGGGPGLIIGGAAGAGGGALYKHYHHRNHGTANRYGKRTH